MEKIYYRQIANEQKVFESCFEYKLPVLLKGPTGCGKTRFVEFMAEKLDRPLVTVVCNDETSAADLLGRYLIKAQDTVWQDGPVTKAVRNGSILYLDEIAEAREDILTIIHPLADHRRELFVDRKPEALIPSPGFMLVVSYNPGYQKSLKQLKPSLRQRFVSMGFDYPSFDVELEILEREISLEPRILKGLVRVAEKIRNLSNLSLVETVSTRILIQTGKLIKSGFDPREACEYGLINALTDEDDDASGMRDIVRMIF